MLSIGNLYFSYDNVQALRGINMTMPSGKVTCVMGRNGVGKTTLIRNIMGILKADSGSVSLGEQNLSQLPAYQRARSGQQFDRRGKQRLGDCQVSSQP